MFGFSLRSFVTICFIRISERSLRFEYQLSISSRSKLPIFGSRLSSKPFGTSFSWIQRDRKSLGDLFRADFACKWFSLKASQSVLRVLAGLAVNKFGLVLSPSSLIVTSILDVEAWLTSISGVTSSMSLAWYFPMFFNNIEAKLLIGYLYTFCTRLRGFGCCGFQGNLLKSWICKSLHDANILWNVITTSKFKSVLASLT